ncbi:MAG: glycosyltransferase family 2 protein [Methanotrichaceae archaeon]|jgi:glycosyltransferase involved in cell wall biosynthesis
MSGIAAILPAFNEEVSIGSMVLRARRYVDRVIVVDDGSSDKTAEVAEQAGAEVIQHPENRGKGAALKTGFEYLNGEKIVVTMDTDGQHNPSDIPKVVEPILKGEADMVNGSRYINGDKKDTPFYRRLGQIVLDNATRLDSGLNITDSQSGFRAFAASTKGVFRFKQNGLAIESEMLADAANAGLRIKEVEIGVRYDVDGSSENPISHGIKVLVKILQDMELNRPLYYFSVPGIVISTIGIGMGLNFLREFYHGSALQFGPTLLMIMLTLVGSFMALTGIILHSISRMFKESKRNYESPSGITGLKTYEVRDSARNPSRDN